MKDPYGEEFISQLGKTLKILIKQVVTKLKEKSKEFLKDQAVDQKDDRAMTVSSSMPEDYDSNGPTMSEKKCGKSTVVGETKTSFEICEGYDLYNSKLDKLPMPHLLNPINPGVKCDTGLKFLERLNGWKLQCRQRSSGALDMYFYHLKAKKYFRSNNEVVNFILYEICPSRPKKETEAPNENFSGSKRDKGVRKRSRTPSDSSTSRKKSKKKHSTAGISEVKKKAVNEVPIAFNAARIEDYFYSENTRVPKRKRTKSRRAKKYVAVSSDVVAFPSVPAISDTTNAEVQNRRVSVLELHTDNLCGYHKGYMPKPCYSPYEYEMAACLIDLKYGRLGGNDIF